MERMKKVGIITLFGYHNYGNRLQMYAVQKIYQSLGYETEIIKFKIPEPKDPLWIRIKVFVFNCLTFKKSITKFYLQNKRKNKFLIHAKEFYYEASEYTNPLNVKENFHEKFTFLSVGSDQVWGWFTHAISDFVFLKFAPQKKRIALSPSLGSDFLNEKYWREFSDGFSGFQHISVREESGAAIISKLTGRQVNVLCDPTMCLSKGDWIFFSNNHKHKPKSKYVLTYFLGNRSKKVEELLLNFSADYEVVNLNSLEFPKFYTISASEWVDYIKDSHLFLTDSFHGIVFSIIMKTPFAVYSRIGGEDMQTRITHILKKFGMKQRFELYDRLELLNQDFSHTEILLEEEKLKVLSFLEESLKQ